MSFASRYGRASGITGAAMALVVLAVCVGGCTKSVASGWAQNSPVIKPDPPAVHLGTRGQ